MHKFSRWFHIPSHLKTKFSQTVNIEIVKKIKIKNIENFLKIRYLKAIEIYKNYIQNWKYLRTW